MLAAELSGAVQAAWPHLPAGQPAKQGTRADVHTGSFSLTSARGGGDRVTSHEAVIGGEAISFGMVAEGYQGPELVNWCTAKMLRLIVKLAGEDPSGASLMSAGWRACRSAQDVAQEVAGSPHCGCTFTIVAVNRVRREVTTCSLGACLAVFLGRGSTIPLSEDHRIDTSAREQQRLRELNGHIARMRGPNGMPEGPLRLWPMGLRVARGIGFLGAGEFLSATPFCNVTKLPASGGDVVVCSDGVWDELLLSSVAGLARASPSAAAAARVVVESAATQHKAYYQEQGLPGTPSVYGQPRDDSTCLILRVGKEASAARKMSYAEARAANKRFSPAWAPRPTLGYGSAGAALRGSTPVLTAATTPGTATPMQAVSRRQSDGSRDGSMDASDEDVAYSRGSRADAIAEDVAEDFLGFDQPPETATLQPLMHAQAQARVAAAALIPADSSMVDLSEAMVDLSEGALHAHEMCQKAADNVTQAAVAVERMSLAPQAVSASAMPPKSGGFNLLGWLSFGKAAGRG